MAANKSAVTGQIHRANTVDISKFTFSDPTVNKYGLRTAQVKYDGKQFYIQGPRMRLPYGLGTYEEKDKAGISKTLIRISVGIEQQEDITRNILQALEITD